MPAGENTRSEARIRGNGVRHDSRDEALSPGSTTGPRATPSVVEGHPMPAAHSISSRDLYRLRRARLRAADAALQAQLAQHQIDLLILELERRYSLLGRDATVDIHTGRIAENGGKKAQGQEVGNGPG